jgi:hypothetical protein
MKNYLTILMLISLVFTLGCASFKEQTHPTMPAAPPIDLISKERIKPYMDESYRAKYDTAMAELPINQDKAKAERNKIVYELLGMIDRTHATFMNSLRDDVAAKNILTDFFVLGLNAAGTVMGGEALKSILSVTSAGVVGANASIDKNFFANNTIESLYNQMRTSKEELETTITNGIKKTSIYDYPLEAALRDVWQYYLAGTLLQAVTDLAQTTGSEKTKADQKLTTAKNPQAVVPAPAPAAR